MGLFSLTQELAIDLGTANTLIIYNGKVVVDEPSIVALDVHTGKVVAIGHQARQMHEKTNPNIKTIRPLKDGVIADFNATELMLRGMIKKVKTSGSLFAPSLRMVICIPSGSTNVEIRAVRDSAEHAGGREVYMIYEPMAAAVRRRSPASRWAASSAPSQSIRPATSLPTTSRAMSASSIISVSANARPKPSSVRSVPLSPTWRRNPRISWSRGPTC